jgi:DNA-binding MarR family transcriptional regulator
MAETPRRLPVLPCACGNLRRAARAVTRLYDQELRPAGLEAPQFMLLMALNNVGEATQGRLGFLLALDSTTLTRTLGLLLKRGLIRAVPGKDRRQRLLSLTPKGRRKYRRALPRWERAQQRLKGAMSQPTWDQLGSILTEVTRATG